MSSAVSPPCSRISDGTVGEGGGGASHVAAAVSVPGKLRPAVVLPSPPPESRLLPSAAVPGLPWSTPFPLPAGGLLPSGGTAPSPLDSAITTSSAHVLAVEGDPGSATSWELVGVGEMNLTSGTVASRTGGG